MSVPDSEVYEAERGARWQQDMQRFGLPVLGEEAFAVVWRRARWARLSAAEQAAEVMVDAARVRAMRDQREAVERSRVAGRWCSCAGTARGSLCAGCGWWKALVP